MKANANVTTRKICTLGEFAVGKTSIVTRAVRNTFSEGYLTTIGVRVDSKTFEPDPGRTMRMVLWDIAGTGAIDQVRASYLAGSHGLLLVADGTRTETLETALALRDQACRLLDRELPTMLLLNKCDLAGRWEIPPARMDALMLQQQVFSSSAKTGQGIEDALAALGQAVW